MLARRPTKPAQRTRRPRRSEDRRGAATVEFALTSFIVFFLFMAMIEFARFHIVRHSMDQAVYMGARVGIVPGATSAEVDQTVRDRLTLAGRKRVGHLICKRLGGLRIGAEGEEELGRLLVERRVQEEPQVLLFL